MVTEPEYIRKLNELWTDENLQLIKDCFIVHGSEYFALYLDRECFDLLQECKNTKAASCLGPSHSCIPRLT